MHKQKRHVYSKAILTVCTPTFHIFWEIYIDLYTCLAEEEEQSAVNSFLQDLMEQELQDPGMIEELSLDDGEIQKRFRNPILTMEARHQQVFDQYLCPFLKL